VRDTQKWDLVDLHPLATENESFAALVEALRSAGFLVQTYFCFGNWHLKREGRSFEDYAVSLPSALKNTLRRKRKQLSSAANARVEIVTSVEKLPTAISAYEAVYAASWKIPENHPEFVRGLIRLAAEKGWLRLGVLYIDEVPAAAQIWIVANGTAAIYKLAYDDRFARYSVGSILTAELMKYAMDIDHVAQVDYLSGDDEYKRDWMQYRRERWGILAFNRRTANGLIGAAQHFGGRLLKDAAVAARRTLNR